MEDALATKTTAISEVVSTNGCTSSGCGREVYASGLCNAHYLRKSKGRDMLTPIRARKRDNSCTKCGEKTGTKGGWGLCTKHYKNERRALLKDALISVMGGCCSKCGNQYPREVYDFHHIGNKTDSPGNMIASKSLDAISEELSNCVLLCANCHRMEHNSEY